MLLMSKLFKSLNYVPIPSSLSYSWNFGSLLGLFLSIQILSGLFLASHYEASTNSFWSVILIDFDVNSGWLIRSFHANGASFFFILVYVHVWRGLWFGCFTQKYVWFSGISILLLMMAAAFMGYVLPWGQMSFWGATVITNLLSAIPIVGSDLVIWVWGGFSVSHPTLERLFTLHFLLPFVLLGFVMAHVILLHQHGSSNPLGLDLDSDKVYFYPYFYLKDILGGFVCLFLFVLVCIYSPDFFMDPDNFVESNPMITPPHIQPEWYFLFAYAILRSVPNKLGGVVALLLSILSLSLISMGSSVSSRFSMSRMILTYSFTSVFVMLSWLGSLPAEYPFTLLSQVVSVIYFVQVILFITL
uniref:Cytochrome b n=3 Tax=Pediculus humanus TaxID=121225 RepID=X2D1J6_PEDHC|nr:cytochrome b [Pediculus humanus corporis]AHF70661.1 cytochrome b [Pediculus humanus corporis]AHF70663.1 cytochrome b [Pediculus humanus corporis]